MIYLIYTTLLVSALALVMIFKIVAYIAKEWHSIAMFRRMSWDTKREFIYPEEFQEIKSTFCYTDKIEAMYLNYPVGSVDYVSDECVKSHLIKRKVVSMGNYMLENGFIKVEEIAAFRNPFHPDIKYIELTAKVLKPKD